MYVSLVSVKWSCLSLSLHYLTEDYASMCNVAMSGGQGRPYGRDALVAGPVQEYEVSLDYEPHPDQPGALPLYEDEESE